MLLNLVNVTFSKSHIHAQYCYKSNRVRWELNSFLKSESLKLIISNCILLIPERLCLPDLVYVFNPTNAGATYVQSTRTQK